MYTVNDLASATGLTSRQVYDRLSALTPVLADSLQTGQRGAKIVSDAGFAIFRRLVEVESSGLSREAAVKVIAQELAKPSQDKTEARRTDGEPTGEPASVIATLERVIDDQRQEIAFLRAQVEKLLPLALPAPEPERRPWILRLLRPLVAAK